MTYYAVPDVSLRSVAICIVDELGEIHLEESADSDVEHIVHCFARFGRPIEFVGLQADILGLCLLPTRACPSNQLPSLATIQRKPYHPHWVCESTWEEWHDRQVQR